MAKIIQYRKTFPAALIEKLVDCGFQVTVTYCGREMADPYRISFNSGRSSGYRFILQDYP